MHRSKALLSLLMALGCAACGDSGEQVASPGGNSASEGGSSALNQGGNNASGHSGGTGARSSGGAAVGSGGATGPTSGGSASGGSGNQGGVFTGLAGAPSSEPWDPSESPTQVPTLDDPKPAPNSDPIPRLKVKALATNGSRVYMVRDQSIGSIHYSDNGTDWSILKVPDGKPKFSFFTLGAGADFVAAGSTTLNIVYSKAAGPLLAADTPGPAPRCSVEAIHYADYAAYGALSGCDDGLVVKSSDGGASWRFTGAQPDRGNARSATHLGSRIFVGTDYPQAVFYTDDGGESWVETSNGLAEAPAAFVVQLAATDSQVFAKQSNTLGKQRLRRLEGKNWVKPSMSGLPADGPEPEVESITTDYTTTLFVSVEDRGLFLSNDGGESFTPVEGGDLGVDITRMVVAGDKLYIGDRKGELHILSRD